MPVPLIYLGYGLITGFLFAAKEELKNIRTDTA